jgi:hypothetical protein
MSSNLDVNNLTVHGHIVFSDQSVQETSLSNVAAKVQSLSRNPISNTLSITNDDLILNKSLQVSETLNAPFVKLQNLTFMSDIDESGEPTNQSRSFSDILFQRIQTSKQKIDEMIPDIIDPPNKRIRLSGEGNLVQATKEGVTATNEDTGQFVSISPEQVRVFAPGIYIQANNNMISSVDETTGLNAQFQSDQVLINGNPPFRYAQLKFDVLKMASDTTNEYSYILPHQVILDDMANGKAIELNNGTNSTHPKVRIAYNGYEMAFQFNGIFCSGSQNFLLNNNTNFFKLQSAISLKQTNKLDGEYIEKSEILIFTENTSLIKLYQCETYLDDNQQAGWTTQIINKNGADLLIDYPDGKLWFSHSHGAPQPGPIIIKKWATVKLILIFSQQDNDYLWTITQF